MYSLFFRILTIIVALIPLSLFAINDNMLCQRVVVAGYTNWPPYTIIKDQNDNNKGQQSAPITGLGIDLAKRIFQELDVPMHEVAYDDYANMMQGVRDGEIDLIVSTYDNSAIKHDAKILYPAYVIDPVTVAVDRLSLANIVNWDSLSSLSGIMEISFLPDDSMNDYIDEFLHITQQDSLQAAINALKKDINSFIIGSELQLTYVINHDKTESNLSVLKEFGKGGEVYMAFGNNSVCQQYAIYVQKRLQDYKNNGTVDKLIKQYIN